MTEIKKETKGIELNRDELSAISNLLYSGKWNLSMSESNNIITPLINKIARMLDSIPQNKAGKAKKK